MRTTDKVLRFLYESDRILHRDEIFKHFFPKEPTTIDHLLRMLLHSGLIDRPSRHHYVINEHGIARCQ